MANLNRKNKKTAGALQRRVARFLSESAIIRRGESGVVAVSGGADSLCLVHILHALKDRMGIKLTIAHLDHGLRGEDAEMDASFVAQIATEMDVPSVIEKRDVRAFKESHKLSWEEAARILRYEFLAETAKSVGAQWVAVGHTKDDLAETVLMHIIRGSGIYGLKGMGPRGPWPYPIQTRDVRLVRPILELTGEDTRRYCDALNLHARFDASNLSDTYTRNRVRSKLLPQLAGYNTNIPEALARLSRAAAGQIQLLDWDLDKIWDDLAESQYGAVRIRKSVMTALPHVLQVHAVRRAISYLVGDTDGISEVHLDAIIKAIAGRAGTSLNLPRGISLAKEYRVAILGINLDATRELPRLEGEYNIAVPGDSLLPGWGIETKIVAFDEERPEPDKWRAVLDYDCVGSPLVLRSRRPGDRFFPHGMESSKKLQVFMVDAHVPKELRDDVPIFVAASDIVWVAGLRTDNRVRTTTTTKRALIIQMKQELTT
ncbi:MAG: tRNA lysidine(34) synthetase TilS [Dehalococcoidia bacterium]|nr:tRNA lysidine(34) synthetase TilS [Dehalococcoidia bacterium]